MALRASNSASDFALLELTQTPPDSYDVFFAGWDRTGTIPERQIGIHHPDGDLKKISFDNDPAATANWSGAATWHIFDWDDGTTEPGSSGSPLFDQNKRIIGQLYGGTANCNNNVDDYYGRFNVSWDGGNNTNNELISWLDACGTNVTVLDGLDGNVALENDVAIAFENKPNVENCGTNIPQRIILTNNGSNAVTAVSFEYGLSDNVQTYNWTGNLAEGQSTTITLDKLYLCKGSYNYVLSILSSNLAVDQKPLNNTANFSFSVVNGSAFEAVIKTNFSGAESSFELYNSSNQIIYSGSGYGNNTTNTINYCLPYGDYIFKMKDSGGNGLTPTFVIDNGFYTLSINGTQIHTNSAFGAEESISFHIDANGISADFIVPPVIVNTPITLFSNSAGNPTAYTWEAPAANTTLGNNISFNTTFSIEGTFPVVLTIETDTACDFISKDVIVTKNTVGIDDLNNNLNIQLYPNPSNGVFTLIGKDVKNAQLQIYNVLGQLVLQQLMINDEEIISLPNLSEGVFQIVITNSNKQTMLNHIIK